MVWVVVGALLVAAVLGYVVATSGKATPVDDAPKEAPTPPMEPQLSLSAIRFESSGLTVVSDRPDDRTFGAPDGTGLRVSIFRGQTDLPIDLDRAEDLAAYFRDCLALYGGKVESVVPRNRLGTSAYELCAELHPAMGPSIRLYTLGLAFADQTIAVHAWGSASGDDRAKRVFESARDSLAYIASNPAPRATAHGRSEKAAELLARAFDRLLGPVRSLLAKNGLGIESDDSVVRALVGVASAEGSVESAYEVIAGALPSGRRDADSMKRASAAARDLIAWWNGEGRAQVHTPHLVEHGLWSKWSAGGVGQRIDSAT